MKLSFSTAALFPRDAIDSLKLIERAGYHYAELMPQCAKETKPEFAREILKTTGLKVGSIHFPLVFFSVFYNPYHGMIKEAEKMINDLTMMAEVLNSRVIVIHPPYFGDETVKKIFYEPVLHNMRYLCEKSMEHGVKVALENSPKGGRTTEEMMKIIEEVNHKNLFPMIDTTEAIESDQNPVQMIEALDVIHIHASDHKGDKKHILPGEGDLDWENIISVLKKKNYSGLFTVEPAYRYLLEDPVEKMQTALKFLEKFLG